MVGARGGGEGRAVGEGEGRAMGEGGVVSPSPSAVMGGERGRREVCGGKAKACEGKREGGRGV